MGDTRGMGRGPRLVRPLRLLYCLAEVGFEDTWIVLDRLRWACRDDRAVFEHGNALAQVKDHLDDVLDQGTAMLYVSR